MNIITQFKANIATAVALNIKNLEPKQADLFLYDFMIAYNHCKDILEHAKKVLRYSDYLPIRDYCDRALNCMARYIIKEYAQASKYKTALSIDNIAIKY